MSGAIRHGGAKSSKGDAMAQDYDINIKVKGLGAAANQLADFTDELNKAREEGASISGALDTATGGAVTGFRKAAAGTKTFITGLKLTRAAIIATGIGALVVGVTALVGAFTQTERGARQLKVLMAGLGSVVENLTARFRAAGGFLVDLFTKGQTAAVENYNDALKDLPASMQEGIAQARRLEREMQALTDRQIEMTKRRAEDRKDIKEYNMVAEDTTKSFAEREKAAQSAIDLEKALMAERLDIATEEARIHAERMKMGDSTEEDRRRQAELEAEVMNLQTESFELQTTLNNKLNTIRNQAAAEAEAESKRISDAALAKRKAEEDAAAAITKAEQEIIDALDQRDRASLDARTKELLSLEDFYNAQLDKAGDNAELIAQIETQRDTELAALREKFRQEDDAKAADDAKQKTDRERKVSQQLAAERMSAREQEKLALEERYNELAVDAEGNAELLEDIERRRLEARRALYEKFDDEDRARQQENNAKTLADVEAYEAKRAELMESARASTFSILSDLTTAFAKDTEEGQRKAFKRNKAISIAETLVSTYQAAQKAYASQLAVPTPDAPARATIAAGIAVAAGLANVAKIKSQQFTGGGSAGGGGGGGGGGIGGGTQSVGVDVGSLIPNQQTPTPEPVRAYVVENEISNKQALNRELQIQTTL